MRTAPCLTMSWLRAMGFMALGLAAVVDGVPASSAQDSPVADHGKPPGSGIEGEERQAHPGLGGNAGISLAVPIGKVWVGPEVVEGESIYVRRTTVKEGMMIVEVSTTPFLPVLPAGEASILRPDQPAGW